MIENKTVSLKIFLLENKLKIFSRCKRRGEDNASPGLALIIMHNLRVYHFDKPPLTFFVSVARVGQFWPGCPALHSISLDITGFCKDLLRFIFIYSRPQPVGFRFTGWVLF